MAAALCDATALQEERPIWQLALWPPDRAIILSAPPRRRHLQIVVREPLVYQAPIDPQPMPGTYPCTWPNCSRGPKKPFFEPGRLANHRFAAHGIRSSNEQSIARQARRDRKRQAARGTEVPEYIDVAIIRTSVETFLPVKLGPNVQTGPLNPGERELLRRRLCHHVLGFMNELRRAPAEIVVAMAQLAATGLVMPKLIPNAREAELTMQRLEQLLHEPRMQPQAQA